jgi:hypothetical protein
MTEDDSGAAAELAEQEPISNLELGRRAAILNFKLPDTTTYSGRSFILLDLDGFVAGDEDLQRVLSMQVSLAYLPCGWRSSSSYCSRDRLGTTVTIIGSRLIGTTKMELGPAEANPNVLSDGLG